VGERVVVVAAAAAATTAAVDRVVCTCNVYHRCIRIAFPSKGKESPRSKLVVIMTRFHLFWRAISEASAADVLTAAVPIIKEEDMSVFVSSAGAALLTSFSSFGDSILAFCSFSILSVFENLFL
jgi:hypothetical protein